MSQDQENGTPVPEVKQEGAGEPGAQASTNAPTVESQGVSDGAAPVSAEAPAPQAAPETPVAAPTPAPEPIPPAPAPVVQPPAPVAPQPKPPAPAPKAPVATPKAGAGTVEKTSAPVSSSVASTGAESAHLFDIPEVDAALKDVPPAFMANLQRLKDYIVAMDPKRPTPLKERVMHQGALFGVLTNTINRQEEHFRPMWSALIRLFAHHSKDTSGVFHDVNVFRDFDNIELKSQDRQGFMRLLALLQLSVRLLGSSAEGRAAQLKQFDFQDALRYSLNDSGRSRLLEYYNVS
jgi:hypothetical protein